MSSRFNNSIRLSVLNGRGRSFPRNLLNRGTEPALSDRAQKGRRMGVLASLAVVLILSSSAFAQSMGTSPVAIPPDVKPKGLENVGVEQRLNEQLPLNLEFRDESGKTVKLGDYFGSKPVVLSFVYYRCPMLCPELLVGLESALKVLKFNVGEQFEIVTVSFDPRDTPQVAAAKKAEILSRYKRPGAAEGWHFLTGSQESITALTKAAGFGYQYDKKNDQFAHATAIMVATPSGKLAQYYYGVDFPPRDLRLALIQASNNKIGNLADAVILYCFHYDPVTGKYNAMVGRILQLAGGATILFMGAGLLFLFRRGSDYENRRQGSSHYVR
ncbi:MAG TPA: SCO family protein [Terriglobales bacterium]|nr:SCO family protein [Terriglobales bacterium]